MSRQRTTRRAVISFGLTVCMSCLTAGCGQSPGDEYRTFSETVAVAPPAVELVAARNLTDTPSVLATTPTAALPDGAPVPMTEPEPPAAAGEGPPAGLEAFPFELAGETAAFPTSREIRLLIPENEFHTVGPDGALRVSYDDIDLLKVLNMDPVPETAPNYFPDWLNGLDGRRVRIRGFMMPPIVETGLSGLLLARDNELCCFGRNPMPYDIVPVILREGLTTDYIEGRPFDVVGVFHIEIIVSPDRVDHVYVIDDAMIID